jgi:hypothetical protein
MDPISRFRNRFYYGADETHIPYSDLDEEDLEDEEHDRYYRAKEFIKDTLNDPCVSVYLRTNYQGIFGYTMSSTKWDNHDWSVYAEAVAQKSDEELEPYLAELFDWCSFIYDDGTDSNVIAERLKRFKRTDGFIYAAKMAIRRAVNDITMNLSSNFDVGLQWAFLPGEYETLLAEIRSEQSGERG